MAIQVTSLCLQHTPLSSKYSVPAIQSQFTHHKAPSELRSAVSSSYSVYSGLVLSYNRNACVGLGVNPGGMRHTQAGELDCPRWRSIPQFGEADPLPCESSADNTRIQLSQAPPPVGGPICPSHSFIHSSTTTTVLSFLSFLSVLRFKGRWGRKGTHRPKSIRPILVLV